MTPEQIAALRGYRDLMVANPSIAAANSYYLVLAEAGIDYGNLARGVVLDSTLFGVLANNYMENELVTDRGRSAPASSEILELQKELIRTDFARREEAGFQGDLTGNQISDYHDDAFGLAFSGVDLPQEAWTAYHIVWALDAEAWRVSSDPWLATPQVTSLVSSMTARWIFGTSGQRYHAAEWLNDMIADGVAAKSAAEWAGKNYVPRRNWIEDTVQKFGALEAPWTAGETAPSAGFILKTTFVSWTAGQASLGAASVGRVLRRPRARRTA